ncbi:MAG: hypothetical protein JJ900_13825 [Rhodospirillales bacterium]|nr:hypothetical protein [Rhodospirillales bacterium]MBO6787922.1 hypothetical protein [Rhodospirillales bacterium]
MNGDEPRSILIENERDSLHILPLEILALQTPGLRRARMIKNAALNSVIELFQDASAGSGQLDVRDLPNEFDWDEGNNHPDMIILRKVAALPSYDVYSLRVALRQLGIAVNDNEALKLSPEMNAELTTYMTDFTRPLIVQIYGKEDDVQIETFEDVIELFRDPDVKMALEKLKTMADKLGIKPDEVPTFIEDYGDIFLSLSYYRRCLDSISPIIEDFLDSLPELRKSHTLQSDQGLQETVNMMDSRISKVTAQLRRRFDEFENGTKNMWDDISAEKFRKLQQQIKSHHVSLGGVLCALSVKMDAWHQLFPRRAVGGPQKRGEFIMLHMRQGMDKMRSMDDGVKFVAFD